MYVNCVINVYSILQHIYFNMVLVTVSHKLLILAFYVLPEENVERSTLFTIITIKIILGVMPAILLIACSKKCFSIMTIDQDGIHRALFNVFYRELFLWEDIKALKVMNRVDSWLFIGRVDMIGLDYYNLIRHKSIMQMSFYPSVLKALRKYSNMKIENHDE